MKRFIAMIGSVSVACSIALPAIAATGETLEEKVPLTPIISGPTDIAVGRTLVLDASASVGIEEDVSYRWYRDSLPQSISRTVEAVYTPEKPGITVIRLAISTILRS